MKQIARTRTLASQRVTAGYATSAASRQAPTIERPEGGKIIAGRVVWVNGPFGVGKTTVAELVASQLPSGVLFDPEEVGFLLRRSVPVPTGDFQDVRAWRHLTTETILAIVGEHIEAGGSVEVVVPMSLTNSSYRTEIFEAFNRGCEIGRVRIDGPAR